MKKRLAGTVLAVVLAGGASPALADCCSDVIGCVAAVVTYGVSCEVQAIIDTVKTLITEVSNLVSSVDGSAQATVNAAKQAVSDTYNSMLAQSQQGSADLSSASTQAAATAYAEQHPRIASAQLTTVTAPGIRTSSTDTQNATPYDRQSAPVAPATVPQQQASSGLATATFNGPTPSGITRVGSAAPGNPTQAQTQLGAAAGPAAVTVASTLGAPMAYTDIMQRGQKAIDALKQSGDADAAKVNGYLTSAMNSEGPGLASADQMISNIINAPLNNMLNYLNTLVSNPTKIFDPSSNVDALEKSITDNLDYNLDEVTKTIQRGPQANFDAAQPSFDELASVADQAQVIAAAMQRLYQQRTKGAFDALAALLPADLRVLHATPNAAMKIAVGSSRRLTYAQLRAPVNARQQQAVAQIKARTQQVKTVLARFNTQRLKGRTQDSPALVQGYQSTTTQKLNGYFSGRTAAQIGQQRDQLVAQARSRFASDPQTGNAVINYINTDAAKRTNGALAAAPAMAAPGVAPAMATTQAATPAPTGTSTQVAPVAWGTAGAWKPPVSAQPAATAGAPAGTTLPGSVTTTPATPGYRPVTGLKTAQPPTPVAPPVGPRPAPSSLGSN